MSSHRVSPWPVEMKSQPRRGSAQGRCEDEHAVAAVVHPDLGVLAVHVVDPVGEVPEEADVVQALPDHVRRVEVEPEARPVADRVQGRHGRPVVVRDLARVHLVREPDADLVEDVDDRVPAVGEVGVAGLDDVVADRREHGQVVPDRRAGEADHGVHAEGRGGAGGGLHLLGGPLPDALGVAVAPDPRVDHVLVALVDDGLADRLAVEVVGDRPAAADRTVSRVSLLPRTYASSSAALTTSK